MSTMYQVNNICPQHQQIQMTPLRKLVVKPIQIELQYPQRVHTDSIRLQEDETFFLFYFLIMNLVPTKKHHLID